MRSHRVLLAAASALALALACGKAKAEKQIAMAQAPTPQGALTGPVLEALPAPPYLYLRLKTPQGEVWAAVPSADVKVGSTVTVLSQMKMEKFPSSALNRTFDVLYMGTLASPGAPATAGAQPGQTAMPAAPGAQPAQAGHGAPMSAGPDEKVAKASGADAHTVAELYANRSGFNNKSVTVKAKVVKYSEGILGRNWIHLRDGSGNPQTRDNDLTITTKDTTKPGDIVTVKGVVHLNKDVGSGYVYPVILEDAKIIK